MKTKKNFLLKFLSAVLVFSLLSCSTLFVQATDIDEGESEVCPTIEELMNDPAFVEEQANSLVEYFQIDEAQLNEYKATFDNLIAEEFVALDEYNHLFATEKFISSLSEEDLNIIQELIQFMNGAIDSGLVEFEINSAMNYSLAEDRNAVPEQVITYTVKVTPFSEFIKNEEGMELLSAAASDFMNDDSNTHAARSGSFNLGSLVNQNKIRIRNFYSMYLSAMGMSAAFGATVGVWVSLVRGGGAWDYKVQPGYQGNSFNCIYGPKGCYYSTMSAEQIGNYNYGYTGWLLFPQTVLLAGSVVAGGGSISKDKHDWPDIKAGYRDSGDVKYK